MSRALLVAGWVNRGLLWRCYGDKAEGEIVYGDINLFAQSCCGDLPPLWGQKARSHDLNHYIVAWRLNVRPD